MLLIEPCIIEILCHGIVDAESETDEFFHSLDQVGAESSVNISEERYGKAFFKKLLAGSSREA